MFRTRKRRERKLSMLTQGALRQRRRRALESAEERRERLARDAERKRIKRMSESAEEAAWRRTVDAMRKKEKRLKERETKAIMAQYGTPTERIKADVSSDDDPVLKVVRPYPRKRRPRHMPSVGDYLLSFPEGVADITEFGSGPSPPLLCELMGGIISGGIPGTSRALQNHSGTSSSSGPLPGDDSAVQGGTIHRVGTASGGAVLGCDFPSLMPTASKGSFTNRPLPPNSGTSKRHQRRAAQGHPDDGTDPISPGLWCSDAVAPMMASGSLCGVAVGGDATEPKTFATGAMGSEKEEFLDSSPDESLSALSPEVIISEVKPEPLEDEEEQLSGEKMRQAALSALSPEVIIREVRMGLPSSISSNHSRRAPRMDECAGHQLCGQWFASSALSVNEVPAEDGHQEGTGSSIYSGRPRGDFLLGV